MINPVGDTISILMTGLAVNVSSKLENIKVNSWLGMNLHTEFLGSKMPGAKNIYLTLGCNKYVKGGETHLY